MSQKMDQQTDVIHAPAGVWIHTARDLGRRKQSTTRQETSAYSLWYIDDGTAVVHAASNPQDSRTAIRSPCTLLLSPGDDRVLQLDPFCHWAMLRFDMQWRPLLRMTGPHSISHRPQAGTAAQQALTELWQCPIPLPLPAAACTSLPQTIMGWTSNALRGGEAWERTNRQLADWLADLRNHLHNHGQSSRTVIQLQQLCKEHLHQGIDASGLASLLGISRRQLNRRLAEEDPAGPRAHELVFMMRMRRAENNLRSTAKSIAMIARLCGYKSANAFADAFKRHSGMAPGAWRQQESSMRSESKAPEHLDREQDN